MFKTYEESILLFRRVYIGNVTRVGHRYIMSVLTMRTTRLNTASKSFYNAYNNVHVVNPNTYYYIYCFCVTNWIPFIRFMTIVVYVGIYIYIYITMYICYFFSVR
jgi:hypothetical protein